MKKLIIISLLGFLLFVVVVPVCSELIDRGGGLIYDPDRNITWLQDANMGGFRNWYDALAWADSLVFGGFEDWRLPSAVPSPGGVNIITYDWTASEMGHLYYTELGNFAAYGGPAPPINPGPFTNLPNAFWSGTGADGPFAWTFNFSGGGQNGGLVSSNLLGSWAVRDGDVIPHTHCVSTSAELQDALNVAATNSTPDIIRIRSSVNPYVGNFVYTSTEPYSLTMEGGYTDCSARVVDPANTVLDAQGSGRVLTLDSSEASDIVVDGLTIQNGITDFYGGGLFIKISFGNVTITNNNIINNSGGVFIEDANSLTLSNNIVMDNVGGFNKGSVHLSNCLSVLLDKNIISNNMNIGIYCRTDTITLSDNIISNNQGGAYIKGPINQANAISLVNNSINYNTNEDVGGVWVCAERISLENNFLSHNNTNRGGGLGVSGPSGCSSVSEVTLVNNIISQNSATEGGGVYIFGYFAPEVSLTNNTIWGNDSNSFGGGIWLSLNQNLAAAFLNNNIIMNNSATDDGNDLYLLNDHNIDHLPSEVNLLNNDFDQSSNGTYIQIPFPIDSSNLDNEDPKFDIDGYHLTASSPCIDAGATVSEPTDDIDGDTRPQGAGYDIGADEYVISDSDGDGIPDDQDACPFSDLSETVVIDGCDSGVDNVLLDDGCTISDLILECADDAKNHGEFVRSASHTTNSLKKEGIISGNEKGKIQKCAAKSHIP